MGKRLVAMAVADLRSAFRWSVFWVTAAVLLTGGATVSWMLFLRIGWAVPLALTIAAALAFVFAIVPIVRVARIRTSPIVARDPHDVILEYATDPHLQADATRLRMRHVGWLWNGMAAISLFQLGSILGKQSVTGIFEQTPSDALSIVLHVFIIANAVFQTQVYRLVAWQMRRMRPEKVPRLRLRLGRDGIEVQQVAPTTRPSLRVSFAEVRVREVLDGFLVLPRGWFTLFPAVGVPRSAIPQGVDLSRFEKAGQG